MQTSIMQRYSLVSTQLQITSHRNDNSQYCIHKRSSKCGLQGEFSVLQIADFGMSQVLTGESSRVPIADTHGEIGTHFLLVP